MSERLIRRMDSYRRLSDHKRRPRKGHSLQSGIAYTCETPLRSIIRRRWPFRSVPSSPFTPQEECTSASTTAYCGIRRREVCWVGNHLAFYLGTLSSWCDGVASNVRRIHLDEPPGHLSESPVHGQIAAQGATTAARHCPQDLIANCLGGWNHFSQASLTSTAAQEKSSQRVICHRQKLGR